MKFETLKLIESLLEENVTVQKLHFETCKAEFDKVLKESVNKEDEFEDSYQFWKDKKKEHYDKFCIAEAALKDFRDHKWR